MCVFTQMRLIQEAELKAAAADREINFLRSSLHQEKGQVQELHELLALKEQEHRSVKYGQIRKIWTVNNRKSRLVLSAPPPRTRQ